MSPKLEAINDELGQLSVVERLTMLAFAIIEDEPTTDAAISSLITVASIMARQLLPVRRTAIAFHLKAEADELNAKWN
jgi:hypothetical protein